MTSDDLKTGEPTPRLACKCSHQADSSACMQVLTSSRLLGLHASAHIKALGPFPPQLRAGLNTGIVKEVERRVQALDQVIATDCH